MRCPGPRSRRCPPAAGRRGPRGQQLVRRARVDSPRNRCETSRSRCQGACGSSRPAKRSSSSAGAPDAAICAWTVSALARLEVAGEEGQLAVDHQARAHLEDVGGLAEQPRVLHHLGAPAARLDHHLHPGAVAGLERARGEQREVALGVAEQRGARAEQRAVEVGVDAAQGHTRERAARRRAGAPRARPGSAAVGRGAAGRGRRAGGPRARSRSGTTRSTASAIGPSSRSGWWRLRRTSRSTCAMPSVPPSSVVGVQQHRGLHRVAGGEREPVEDSARRAATSPASGCAKPASSG